MARSYTGSFTSQTVASASGDYELFEFDPATDKPIEIYGLSVVVTSEIGEEERFAISIIRGHTTDGTGGASGTLRPLGGHDTAAGCTIDTLRTAIASSGTPVTLLADGFDVRAGYAHGPLPPTEGYRCSADEGLLVVRLTTGVTDDVTMSATCWVREL